MLGILKAPLRRAALPAPSRGTEEAGASSRSPLPLRASRDRNARACERRALRVPRFATVNLAVKRAPAVSEAGGFPSARTTRSGPGARAVVWAEADATSTSKAQENAKGPARSKRRRMPQAR